MTFWELVKNSPEWVSAIAAVVFGFFSTVVILWQVVLMWRQGNRSAHLLAQQNRLIRWQHEHEWIYEKNRVRNEIRDLTRRLHLAVLCLKGDCRELDKMNWERLQDVAYELSRRLSALDLSVYTTPYDDWYPPLQDYVEAILAAIVENAEFAKKYGTDDDAPTPSIVQKIKQATNTANPNKIELDLEGSIRMDFFGFKQKWDQAFQKSE